MAVTEVRLPPKDLRALQVERLVNSQVLHGAESLRRLLRYLADRTLLDPANPPKEYQIATDVFGRAAGFDPKQDSTVRVQTGRLRAKLAEYYVGEGASDPLFVEIPRGSYTVVFRDRATATAAPDEPASPSPAVQPALSVPPSRTKLPVRSSLAPWLTAAAFAALSLALAATLYLNRQPAQKPERRPRVVEIQSSPSLRAFWQPFLDSGDFPLVVYSNAEFTGHPLTGMRYLDPRRDANKQILDHYTGIGEVMALTELERLFLTFGSDLRVKRARLLSLDDVKGGDVIFVGSPSENLPLRDLPGTRFFVFRTVEEGERRGDLRILRLVQRESEQVLFAGSPSDPRMTEDYALVARIPASTAGRSVLILAGLTTQGTQAAVEFVCHPQSVETLMQQLRARTVQHSPHFEAVLRVRVGKGVPVASEIVALERY
ncbi:MAG: hypothetical protein SFV54_23100 [Bryobacteraceae bacterium]|nr:hypothetical protein [Bryobacteraceae bacterium]